MILVLDGGRIVTSGTHDELIARGGLYAELWSASAKTAAAVRDRRAAMKAFDPARGLVSIHVPRCAGTSLTTVLRTIYGDRLHLHYPDEAPPIRLDRTDGRCIHGHFWHHAWNIGARAYYPHIDQFITVLRDPLEMLISDYFFKLRIGHRPAESLEAYLESVLQWLRLFTYAGLPFDPWDDEAVEVLAREFVWISVVEQLPQALHSLAALFGVPVPALPRDNTAPRTEPLAREPWASRFRERFTYEYRLYDVAAATATAR